MANEVFERIQGEITEHPVMLYMKGNAMFPQCGFSARVVQILTHMGVPFKTANVLEDEELREGIKQYLAVADDSAAVCEGRAGRRLRHRDRDVPVGRAGDAARREGRRAQDRGVVSAVKYFLQHRCAR